MLSEIILISTKPVAKPTGMLMPLGTSVKTELNCILNATGLSYKALTLI